MFQSVAWTSSSRRSRPASGRSGASSPSRSGAPGRGTRRTPNRTSISVSTTIPPLFPDLAGLSRVARELDDRHPAEPLTPIGGWGPWIDGGAWLEIEGRRVDWIYRDLARVESAIADARGEGFPRTTSRGTRTRSTATSTWARSTSLGPATIRRPVRGTAALGPTYPLCAETSDPRHISLGSRFALGAAEIGGAGRPFPRRRLVFRSLACLMQVLFAANRRYFVNEKKSVEAVRSWAAPGSFDAAVTAAFSGDLSTEGFPRVAALVEETRALAGR